MAGSEISPFSKELKGNFQFRPNFRFPVLLHTLASCPELTGNQGSGLVLNAKQRILLSQRLQPLIEAANLGTLPNPLIALDTATNLAPLFGVHDLDWNLTLTASIYQPSDYDFYFYDGFGLIKDIILRQLLEAESASASWKDFFSEIRVENTNQVPRFVRTEFDRKFTSAVDHIAKSLGASSWDYCRLKEREIAEELIIK